MEAGKQLGYYNIMVLDYVYLLYIGVKNLNQHVFLTQQAFLIIIFKQSYPKPPAHHN